MNTTRQPSPQFPQLVLLKQTDQGDEKFTKNGIVQTAHVVIKNTPFMLQLGLLNNVLFNHVFNFNQFTLEAKLLYDTEGEKEVDYVKVKPLDFKTHLSERGEQCTMEARIKVLSSQHEDLFFRIKVIALDARTGQEFCPSLFVLSQPVKVISKPEKVIKSNSQKKRNFTDMLLETVQKLEKQQKEQQQQINKIFEMQKTLSSNSGGGKAQKKEENVPATVPAAPSSAPPQPVAKELTKKIEANNPLDFEQAFRKLIDSYTVLPAEEKSTKIRKVVRNLTPSDTEALNQLIDLVGSEGLQREPIDLPQTEVSGEHSPKSACDCKNCHYKEELLRIDDFYKDFLGSL